MKISVNAGHTPSGTAGCGAVGYLDESNCTRQIAPKLAEYLKANGHSVQLNIENYSNSYNCEDCYNRANKANNWGANLYVEIHLNAGGGTGTEVEISGFGGKAEQYANRISSKISSALGISNRGIHKMNLIVLNRTNMPAVLVECCFVDSQRDKNAYNADKIAKAIAEAILNKSISSSSTNNNGSSSSTSQSQGKVSGANATIKGDFFYVRDKNGNKLEGRRVDEGDRIKVIDVSYSKQLCYVEYPVPGGTRTGYIKNAHQYIYYDKHMNINGNRVVFDNDKKSRIGSVSNGERVCVLSEDNKMINICYATDKGNATKSGWIYK